MQQMRGKKKEIKKRTKTNAPVWTPAWPMWMEITSLIYFLIRWYWVSQMFNARSDSKNEGSDELAFFFM